MRRLGSVASVELGEGQGVSLVVMTEAPNQVSALLLKAECLKDLPPNAVCDTFVVISWLGRSLLVIFATPATFALGFVARFAALPCFKLSDLLFA